LHVHRFYAHDVLALRAAQMHAVAVDGVDMLGPRVDQRDIFTRARQMRAGVTADCARSHEYNVLAHIQIIFCSRKLATVCAS
jgi:putative N-acetylmannosamine-6-phosphate epimerase